jgi:Rrf2 family transcriptional regulator, nitric oxide-sensitive transcriptional repressor
MRLTLHTDYSLRVLIHVAVADGKLITIRDIAESFDISKQHLMKVVSELSRKGYLDTVRGRGGGIRLRRQPRDINIGQVVRETEDRLEGGAIIARSSASACCAACCTMRLGRFSLSWTDTHWPIWSSRTGRCRRCCCSIGTRRVAHNG